MRPAVWTHAKSLEDGVFCGASPREGSVDFQDPLVDGFVDFGAIHVYSIGSVLDFDVHFVDQGRFYGVILGREFP